MIGISKLYCGTVEPSDALRYGRMSSKLPSHLLQFSSDKRPVVVWNVTRKCNLKCVHCYAQATNSTDHNELATADGRNLIDDLAQFGVPVILFSGGEPLARKDLPHLAAYAVEKGMRAVISTNGTLITSQTARTLKDIGLSYVGISLDGMEAINDRFRGVKGAFRSAMEGIENCKKAGIKVGLRFTVNKSNVTEIPEIFRLIEEMDISRVCFYHLVYAGRGSKLVHEDLSHEESRKAVDLIMDLSKKLHDKGKSKEVLTVDNHADGPYLYLRLLKENPERAKEVLELLKMNAGNSSGIGIGCISWDGEVHADQFWRHYSFGNIKDRPFSKIWMDSSDPLMKKLKEKKKHARGRCATCRWLDICAGNFRVRSEAVTGDVWAPDPACYLTDEEISQPGQSETN
ncbi:MAG: 12,18-didecarboxysiroheme deacetylase [Pseudomonadota bacterium]|uniref:Pre-heme d1 synthase n=1 Tax=Candidatus Desulfatibia profunda TaxID=2841695 RepID=A0A8J6NQY6_9BACT|nr:12,18-didecarboxysiroheme deacetylase [Candidatus Desulfatibia profunda]MBL7180287.1 12,18-didecarboxysiroheme deacetylase [Desulfobacterales bacterium]